MGMECLEGSWVGEKRRRDSFIGIKSNLIVEVMVIGGEQRREDKKDMSLCEIGWWFYTTILCIVWK